MTNKETFLPVFIIGVSLAFILASFLVFISKGKSAKWLNRKMKLGALLLTLNAFTPGSAQEIEVMCYDIAEENVMALAGQKSQIEFNYSEEVVLKGWVDFRVDSAYYYCIVDSKNKEIERGEIEALDGKFDKWKEDFEIRPKTKLKEGRYYLLLFDRIKEFLVPKNANSRIQIDIVK